MKQLCFLLSVLVVFAYCGCGEDSGGRLPVSGTVTYQGAPLKEGFIEFDAQDGSHRTGASITEGAYSLAGSKGLAPGKYTVRVTSVKSDAPATVEPPGPEAAKIEQENKETIPAEFNTASTLTYEAGSNSNKYDVTIP
jgi:hypothetical protein